MMKRIQKHFNFDSGIVRLPGPIDLFSFHVANSPAEATQIAISSGFVKVFTTDKVLRSTPNDVVIGIDADQSNFLFIDTCNVLQDDFRG